MRLKSREIPLVTFRRVLPDFLGPGGECFIEVDARAGGSVNVAYMAAAEQLDITARIYDRQTARITDDADFVRENRRVVASVVKERFAMIYDTCVIEWRSNIVDGDGPIVCNRANFLALTEERVPELAAAFIDIERAVLDAGRLVLADDEDTLKN